VNRTKTTLLYVALAFMLSPMAANATVVLNNVSITSTNLSFDVVGTITSQGSTYQQQLMFGLVDDASDWLISFDDNASTWVSNPGNEHVITYVYDLSGVWTDSILTVGTNDMSIGDNIDLSFNFVGQFNVDNFDLNNFGMSNGLNTSCCIVPSDLNLVSSASGSASAPEPAKPIPTMSAYGLALTMLGLLLVASRRLRSSVKRR